MAGIGFQGGQAPSANWWENITNPSQLPAAIAGGDYRGLYTPPTNPFNTPTQPVNPFLNQQSAQVGGMNQTPTQNFTGNAAPIPTQQFGGSIPNLNFLARNITNMPQAPQGMYNQGMTNPLQSLYGRTQFNQQAPQFNNPDLSQLDFGRLYRILMGLGR